MLTKAHHPTSLTEGQTMNQGHEGIEARRHEVMAEGERGPSSSHFPSSLRRSVASSLPLSHRPRSMSQNVPECPNFANSFRSHTRPRTAAHHRHANFAKRSQESFCRTRPDPPGPAQTRHDQRAALGRLKRKMGWSGAGLFRRVSRRSWAAISPKVMPLPP